MALDAIARTGSFAAAGSTLHKVPSAISYSIQTLESVLGVEVFDRSRRKAVLTPAGHKLLEESRAVLERAKRLERVAAELQDGWEPELHVVVDGALPMESIIRAIRRFSDAAVPTSLRLDVEYQEGVVDRFEDFSADLALVLGFSGDGDDEGYDCTPLEPLELVLVASSDHPLVGEGVEKEARSIYSEIVVRDSSPRFSKRSKASYMGSKNVVYLSDFHSKRIALLACAGYGWIPRHFVEEDLRGGDLVLIDEEPNTWKYHPQLVSRQGDKIGKGARLFLETMNELID